MPAGMIDSNVKTAHMKTAPSIDAILLPGIARRVVMLSAHASVREACDRDGALSAFRTFDVSV